MYLGKLNGESMTLVECENGKEVNGNRTEVELREHGYKNACLIEKPSDTVVETWQEFPDCYIQIWNEVSKENEDS